MMQAHEIQCSKNQGGIACECDCYLSRLPEGVTARNYLAPPPAAHVPESPAFDGVRDEGPDGLREYFAMLHRLVNRHGSSISGERFECRDALGKIESEVVRLRRELRVPPQAPGQPAARPTKLEATFDADCGKLTVARIGPNGERDQSTQYYPQYIAEEIAFRINSFEQVESTTPGGGMASRDLKEAEARIEELEGVVRHWYDVANGLQAIVNKARAEATHQGDGVKP